MVSAYSTVIDHNIPCPQSNSIPLKSWLAYEGENQRRLLAFFTSKRFFPSAPPSLPAFPLPATFFATAAEPEGASVMSTSAMLILYDDVAVVVWVTGCVEGY